jgi:hypothetical protein
MAWETAIFTFCFFMGLMVIVAIMFR